MLVLLCLLCAAACGESIVKVRPAARDVYEEVVEDRYNIMDINDPIYDSIEIAASRLL